MFSSSTDLTIFSSSTDRPVWAQSPYLLLFHRQTYLSLCEHTLAIFSSSKADLPKPVWAHSRYRLLLHGQTYLSLCGYTLSIFSSSTDRPTSACVSTLLLPSPSPQTDLPQPVRAHTLNLLLLHGQTTKSCVSTLLLPSPSSCSDLPQPVWAHSRYLLLLQKQTYLGLCGHTLGVLCVAILHPFVVPSSTEVKLCSVLAFICPYSRWLAFLLAWCFRAFPTITTSSDHCRPQCYLLSFQCYLME